MKSKTLCNDLVFVFIFANLCCFKINIELRTAMSVKNLYKSKI